MPQINNLCGRHFGSAYFNDLMFLIGKTVAVKNGNQFKTTVTIIKFIRNKCHGKISMKRHARRINYINGMSHHNRQTVQVLVFTLLPSDSGTLINFPSNQSLNCGIQNYQKKLSLHTSQYEGILLVSQTLICSSP